MSALTATLLALFGLLGGIGISAIGPGGVLPTIGLATLTALTPAQVAGTALVTHVATGCAGTGAYLRSGELRRPQVRRTAQLLCGTAVFGTPLGILVNSLMSPHWFNLALAALMATVAGLVLMRERVSVAGHPARMTDVRPHPSAWVVGGVGGAVAVAAGVVGIGGPMLTVPLLVAAGVDMLEALAAAQAQSVLIAGVGSVGYALQGSIDWPLAALVGIPELAGVFLGWRIARALPVRSLRLGLVAALLVVAPYVALHG
ncbi:sulfite exporter TauE/SafE family protein [Flexivirga sp. ID2601S]|uniref:Probable membrane transporter protein n=1 Tax=Flexivirga aerilata TaxID=1656889 RepID=A0A849AE92_9MICO|nr:sulfite exporter TauE/SafE family protein [Flexivirga aerilata]NNG38227.1 sulfite exporter TauE/SafE family protein [Flexivirga aerilata]